MKTRYNPYLLDNRNPYKSTIPFNRDSRMERLPIGKIFYLDFKYEGIKESEGERIFSDLDPYGEENWNK